MIKTKVIEKHFKKFKTLQFRSQSNYNKITLNNVFK